MLVREMRRQRVLAGLPFACHAPSRQRQAGWSASRPVLPEILGQHDDQIMAGNSWLLANDELKPTRMPNHPFCMLT
jgi:hypothetical protein